MMSHDALTILSDALTLPPEVREELAEKLFASLDSGSDDIPGAWKTEIRQRMDAYRKGESKPIPGKQVIDAIRKDILHDV